MHRTIPIIFFLVTLCITALAAQADRIMLPMKDGTTLATDIYIPEGTESYPTLFARTPYNIDVMIPLSENFVKQGYAVVMQDTRGIHNSKGIYMAFEHDGWGENKDGLETLRWIREQPWSNGEVATWGGSALGITQIMLAGAGDPITCQFILVASSNSYGQLSYQGGVLRKSLVEGWLTMQKAPQAIETMKAHPTYDAYWKLQNVEAIAPTINAPAVHLGGWFDIFAQGTINNFTSRQYNGGPKSKGLQKLILGPWPHGVKQKVGELNFPDNFNFDINAYQDRYYDYWMMGKQNGIMDEPAVQYYTMGDCDDPKAPGNEWRTADNWPPFPTIETAYYLSKNQRLNTRPPKGRAHAHTYTYDPNNPVGTHGGANLLLPAGPFDQREQDQRDDVITFMTQALDHPTEVTGAIKLKLFVSSSAVDTDFTAKLLDIYPDGRQMLITDNIQRVKFRNGFEQADPLSPGTIGELEIDLASTSLIYNKGHRIAVQISSSNFPRFEINPNTGDDRPGGVESVVAENTIHFGTKYPSALILPIRPAH
jgi:uncharacterized protein